MAEDCTISVQCTRYTVPARLAHQQVRVRLYAERFEVLDRSGAVALARPYATGDEARRLQLDPAHYADLPRSRSAGGGRTQRLKAQVLIRWPALEPFVDGLHAHVKGLLHVHLLATAGAGQARSQQQAEPPAVASRVRGPRGRAPDSLPA